MLCFINGTRGGVVGAISIKVAGSIPDGVIGIILLAALCLWGRLRL